MKDNKKLLLIISFCSLFIVLILNIIYNLNTRETWIICDIGEKYDNYEEIIKYRFKKNNMLGFYREEKIEVKDKTELDDRYNYFNDIKSELEETDDLSYEITTEDKNIYIKTYIGVHNIPSFFDSYMQATNIKSKSKIDDVLKYYNNEKYTCKKVMKQVEK